jgi:hypothetical protein
MRSDYGMTAPPSKSSNGSGIGVDPAPGQRPEAHTSQFHGMRKSPGSQTSHAGHDDFLCEDRARRDINILELADRTPMGMQRPKMPEEEHVVLQFRPRQPARRSRRLPEQRPSTNAANAGPPDEAGQSSRHPPASDQADDFRHRMLANAAAFAFTIALTAVGLWLAASIADLRNTRDCGLTGLQDCARSAPSQR